MPKRLFFAIINFLIDIIKIINSNQWAYKYIMQTKEIVTYVNIFFVLGEFAIGGIVAPICSPDVAVRLCLFIDWCKNTKQQQHLNLDHKPAPPAFAVDVNETFSKQAGMCGTNSSPIIIIHCNACASFQFLI